MEPIPGLKPLDPGSVVILDAGKLRGMNIRELAQLAQELGINLAGLEDKTSALYTRLMQHASGIEIDE